MRWPDEVIALLQTGEVEELSLDHDLGDDEYAHLRHLAETQST